jgi:Flavin-binding monooxygenase-like
LIPNCPGIETFPAGKITHAKYFRHPATYKDKNVLLVGNGPSGADLANQLILTTKSIKRSVRSEANPLAITDPRVRDIGPIKRFNGNTIQLVDGTELTDIDTVIFCTGYLYSLPMFSKEMGFITPDGAYVHHLYDQTFYCEDPTLTFIGLPKQVLPFPTFQNQAIVVAKVWAQKLYLPPVAEMRKEELERLETKVDPKLYHSFKYPEDVELAERWRLWIEEDKSPGWEKRMKPWRWTDERKQIRKNATDIKKAFLKTIEEGRLDHMMLDKA